MSRTLYSGRRIGSPVIISHSKSFFAQRLGGGIIENGKQRFSKFRPVFDCLCEKEIYRVEKGKLILQKKSLEEEITNLSHKQNDWLEPFTEWVKNAQNMDKIASDNNFFAKKVVAKEIFGSNLLLQNKSVRASAPKILNSFGKMGGNQWDALRASHLLASSKPLSSILVPGVGVEPTRP